MTAICQVPFERGVKKLFVTSDTNHIVVPWRPDLVQLIPHARAFDHQGRRMLLLPNRPDEAKVCRNVGVSVPSPIVTRYDWPGRQPPWDIQKQTAAMMSENSRAYNLNEMGCGKSRSAIWAADYLMRHLNVGPTLITAPLSILSRVWEAELFELLPKARVKILYGDRKKRLKLLEEPADWYIINHHGLNLLSEQLAAKRFGVFIIDEIAVFRNKSTTLWKSANAVVQSGVGYAWGLTGSPTPTAPTDAWAQIRLLTPDNTTRTLTRFRDMTMRQVTTFKWIPRPEATDIVHRAMQPSVRFTLDDVQELPEVSYINREVPLDKEAAQAYKLLFDKMVLMSRAGQITAVNEGVLQNKLLQVACGFLYTDKGKVYSLPSVGRRQALLELVQGTSRKVIVYMPYIHALQGLADFLAKEGESVALVYGGTARGARDRIFREFQEDVSPRVLVAHPQCMAHGLTLTAANTIVWYCPTNSLEIYEQANRRIVRPSQQHKMLIAHLAGTPVEKATYARLRERARMQGMLLDLFHEQLVEY